VKTVGIIGGMSWESTQHYYTVMNRIVSDRMGRHNSLESIIYSVNFERILDFVDRGEWDPVGEIIASLAKKLQTAGADILILASNAIHKVFARVEAAVEIPVIHIVDPTAEAIQNAGIGKIGLLGTQVTMQESFYKDRLQDRYGIETIIPEEKDREAIHKIIFEELTVGKIHDASRQKLMAIVEKLAKRGAGGVILGCTELTLLIGQKTAAVPFFDTTDLHAKAAVELAIS